MRITHKRNAFVKASGVLTLSLMMGLAVPSMYTTATAQTPGTETPVPAKDEDCRDQAKQPDPVLPDPASLKAPKFVCPTPRVTVDPVWRGTNLLFNFEIRNEGNADLEYRVKGG